MTLVKVCGLAREADVAAAVDAGADRLGFVLVPASPRFVDRERAGRLVRLAASLGVEPWIVASANASGPSTPWLHDFIRETPEIAAVQLHGRETPADVAAFAARHPLVAVVKALGVATPRDVQDAASFEAADAFLFDAKPPKGADREGGFGRPFDWSILKGFSVAGHEDWVLSGGLTAENVAEAVKRSGAWQVDVSSGVESAPGLKDPAKVQDFIQAARGG
jgi:phosphoribosylanthranilate isomerase